MVDEVNQHIVEPLPPSKSAHASDVLDSRLMFLMNVHNDRHPHHIHNSARERLPDDIIEEICKLEPSAKATDVEKENAFATMKQTLREFWANRGEEGDRAPCLLHPMKEHGCRLFSCASADGDSSEDGECSEEENMTLLGIGIPCQDESRMEVSEYLKKFQSTSRKLSMSENKIE